jgi:oligopeptide transport system substrate-binding protein
MLRILLVWFLFLAAAVWFTLRAGLDTPADLVVNNEDEVRTLDPACGSWNHDIRAGKGLFEGLTRLDPKTLLPVPGLAEKWDISPDGKTYTFHLRDGLRWWGIRDGQPADLGPLTASDFEYAWKRVLDPDVESEYHNMMDMIENASDYFDALEYAQADEEYRRKNKLEPKPLVPWEKVGVKVLDDRTLRVSLRAPTPFFLELTAFITFWPVHPPTVEAHGKDWHLRPETFACCGPYLLKERTLRRRLRYVKNPGYWDAANVRTNVLDLLPISNPTTSLMAYEAGAIDVITKVPDAVANNLDNQPAAARRKDFKLVPTYGTYFYRFNCRAKVKHPDTGREIDNPLADPRVREAFHLAADRKKLVTEVLKLGRVPMAGFVPTESIIFTLPTGGTLKYDDIPYDPARDHDPAKARRLLDEAGYADRTKFPPVEVQFNDDPGHALIAARFTEEWRRELGIDVRAQSYDGKIASQRIQSLSYMVARSGWFGDYMDPMTFLEMFHSGDGHNQTGYANAEYDKLIEAARIEADVAKRAKMLADAERILVMRDRPIMPIFRYVESAMVRENVRGWHPNPRAEIDVKWLYKEPLAVSR